MAVSDFLNSNDPIRQSGNETVGDLLSGEGGLLSYILVVAGIVLLFMLVAGGIGLMTSAGNPDKVKSNYSKIINALIGFLIIFISYFVAQLVEVMLGVKFL